MLRSPSSPDGTTRESPSPTLLKRLVVLAKQAGGETEPKTKRDGFLSYHAETHALGMGIAAGWWYGAEGDTQLLSLVYGAAVEARAHAANGKRRRILRDIAAEPHYALAGVVAGAVLGSLTSHAAAVTGLDPAAVFEALPALLSGVPA
jgi:hypothetical protein